MSTQPLKSGASIPRVGLGTWQMGAEQTQAAVESALELGYKHLDTAERYQNQPQIGLALSQVQAQIKRSELFITSKVWPDGLTAELVEPALHQTLEELGIEYLDLWLIHWPMPGLDVPGVLAEMNRLQDQGLIKHQGVSNFTCAMMANLPADHRVEVNQIEYHPSLHQEKILHCLQGLGMVVSAYSPLVQGDDLKLPLIIELATKYQVTPAQVALSWLLKKEIVVLPRSSTRAHQAENLAALDVELSSEDHQAIDDLDLWHRLVSKPEWVDLDSDR